LATPAVWSDCYFSFDGTAFSSFVRSLAIDQEVDAVEYTHMGSSFHINLSGLLNWAVEVELNQETSTLDAGLSPITRGTSAGYLVIREDNAAVSTGNKNFIASEARVFAYRPYGGEVGSMAIATLSMGPGGAAIFTTCSTA